MDAEADRPDINEEDEEDNDEGDEEVAAVYEEEAPSTSTSKVSQVVAANGRGHVHWSWELVQPCSDLFQEHEFRLSLGGNKTLSYRDLSRFLNDKKSAVIQKLHGGSFRISADQVKTLHKRWKLWSTGTRMQSFDPQAESKARRALQAESARVAAAGSSESVSFAAVQKGANKALSSSDKCQGLLGGVTFLFASGNPLSVTALNSGDRARGAAVAMSVVSSGFSLCGPRITPSLGAFLVRSDANGVFTCLPSSSQLQSLAE